MFLRLQVIPRSRRDCGKGLEPAPDPGLLSRSTSERQINSEAKEFKPPDPLIHRSFLGL